MKSKKNIERLFQESFKDFEAKPNNKVWGNIQSKLIDKQIDKKKPIFVWYKYAGIAALLLLFFVIGNAVFTSEESNNPNTIGDTKVEGEFPSNTLENSNVNDFKSNSILKDESDFENSSSANTVSSSNESSNKNELTQQQTSKELITNNTTISGSIKDDKSFNHKSNPSITPTKLQKESENTPVVSNLNPAGNNNSLKSNLNNSTTNNNIASSNLYTDAFSNNSEKENDSPLKNGNKRFSDSKNSTDYLNTIALNSTKENNLNLRSKEEKINTTDADLINAIIKKDSLLLVEAIAKTEDSIEKEKEVNRWQVYASIAPVYYNTMGKGSHIHEQFNTNKKNGEVNTSYGVNVGYAINDKITIRAGVNSLNLSYDTANVILFENVSGSNSSVDEYRNIDFNPSIGDSLNIVSNANLQVQQVSPFIGSSFDAAISQRISYLEVPVEIQYDIIESKFNLQLIGGFSTFFLNDNEIYTEIDNQRNYIGKANNINNVSFSTNLGIGIGYNFSDAFQFNLEPTLKYQLNAFSDTSGDFRPYIIGVYTGLSYRF